jgi:predicted GH43/DUF377 family glycosyl hydrolase
MIEHDFALAIHSYYVGELEVGRRACERLLGQPDLPEEIEQMVRHNRLWYTQPLSDLADTRFVQLAVDPAHDGWSTFNPTVLACDDQLVAIVRSSNYRIVDGAYQMPPEDAGKIRTENVLAKISPDLVVRSAKVISGPDYAKADYPVDGLEDCRLRWGCRGVGVSATVRNAAPHADGRCRIATADLDIDDASLGNLRILDGLNVQEHEKNWMPILYGFGWLHSCNLGGHVVTVDQAGDDLDFYEVFRRSESPPIARGWRGGGQVIPFGVGHLAIVHEVAMDGRQRAYEHRFVWLDNSMTPLQASPPFVFRETKAIEFAAGLAQLGDRVIVSFGVRDAEAWLVEIPEADIWRLLKPLS